MLRGTPVFATFCVVSPPVALGVRDIHSPAPREPPSVPWPHVPFTGSATMASLDIVITNLLNREL
jgi:hypothetical protein